jgi:hypothetical protein
MLIGPFFTSFRALNLSKNHLLVLGGKIELQENIMN